MQANSSHQFRGYAPNCPYFQKQSPVINDSFLPMCRITETFEDGQIFIADSFEHGEWIDITEARPCGHGCFCNALCGAVQERAGAFAFTVKKTLTNMEIFLHDERLRDVVTETLNETDRGLLSRGALGFVLLKYRSHLTTRLRQMQQDHNDSPQSDYKVAVLSLLVNGVLNDPRVFKSYGFLWLHEQGYLELEEWEWFYGYQAVSRRRQPSTNTVGDLDESTARVFAALANEPSSSSSNNDDENQSSPYASNHELFTLNFQRPSELVNDTTIPDRGENYDLYGQDSRSQISWLTTGLIGPEAEVGRSNALYQAIARQDFVRVQNPLQSSDGVYERSGAGIANHHQAGQTQDSSEIDAQMLLLAVRMDCVRCTKLLLSHGYDVNSQFYGETPLSVAAVRGSDSLVRLLLRYGAEVPVANLILKSDSPASVRRINLLSQANTFQVTQRRFKANQNLIRLRNNFWVEHALMSERTKSGHSDNLLPLSSYFIEEDVRLAWSTSVATMRDLCNGNPPRSAHAVLLFLALVKSMIPIMRGNPVEVEDIESEFFADITRWQLFLSQDEERIRFISAVLVIWNIDLTQSRLNPLEATSLFSSEIIHIQDLTNRLVLQAYRAFQLTEISELSLPNVQARWRARRATSILSYHEELANHGMQDDTDSSPESGRPSPEMERATALPSPGGEAFMGGIPWTSERAHAQDKILAVVLAGSIFAIVLAFLLLLRDYCSSKTLFPLVKAVSRDAHGGTTLYDPMQMARRTRMLLEFYHKSSLPTAAKNTITSSRRENAQQIACVAKGASYNYVGQQPSPELAARYVSLTFLAMHDDTR
ncbi:hypothetical protein F5B21DRAFT_519979 [Xylaria acuta]|nr:hypothetical protein F5B21DRAFT_519979 [Xylaria acuta]